MWNNIAFRHIVTAGMFLTAILGQNEVAAANSVRVGVLHSLTGTMSISETALKDAMLMLIEEQNKKGGVLGRKIEPVVVDPASDWPTFAEKARELIEKDRVSVVFGCWTSASRKAVLPVFEETNNILIYPVQYEGEESSRNIFYTGAAPNQQAIPAVDFLMEYEDVKRWVLEGTDYVYPRTTNEILDSYLRSRGVQPNNITVNYTKFGQQDWSERVAEIRKFASAGLKTAVISTINGDANVGFYQELAKQGVNARDLPVMAFSVGEQELTKMDSAPLVGHMAAWNYFMSVPHPANQEFLAKFRAYTKNPNAVVNDPIEAHYIGFNMWVTAVKKAGTVDPDAVNQAMIGVAVPNLSGGYSAMMSNHHITKPVLIGEIESNGQFNIVWQTRGLLQGDEYSDYLPKSRHLTADWRKPLFCGKFDTKEGKCLDRGLVSR